MKKVLIEVTKTPDLGYRGHAEPEVGTLGWIDNYCRREQENYGHMLKDPTWTCMRFNAKDLGYQGSEPIKIYVPRDCFKEI